MVRSKPKRYNNQNINISTVSPGKNVNRKNVNQNNAHGPSTTLRGQLSIGKNNKRNMKRKLRNIIKLARQSMGEDKNVVNLCDNDMDCMVVDEEPSSSNEELPTTVTPQSELNICGTEENDVATKLSINRLYSRRRRETLCTTPKGVTNVAMKRKLNFHRKKALAASLAKNRISSFKPPLPTMPPPSIPPPPTIPPPLETPLGATPTGTQHPRSTPTPPPPSFCFNTNVNNDKNNSNNNSAIYDEDDDCILIEEPIEQITICDDTISGNFENTEKMNSHLLTSTPIVKIPNNISETSNEIIQKNDSNNNDNNNTGIVNVNILSPGDVDMISNKDNACDINNSGGKVYNPIPADKLFFKDTIGTERKQTETPAKYINSTNYVLGRNEVHHNTMNNEEESIEIIDIADDTLVNHKSNIDDSVVFVSESLPDFIPISKGTDKSNIQPKKNNQRQQSIFPDLFNRMEKKQLSVYNQNAYNPLAGQQPVTNKRMVFIDGSNVAYHHACNKFFSVKGIEICIEYFEKIGHEVKVIVPQFRLQRFKSSDPDKLTYLQKCGKIILTPCKNLPNMAATSYDDRFLLQLACEMDGAIVSNDNYRDLIHENSAFKKIIENRVIGYTWCNDLFILPKDPYGRHGPTLDMILNRPNYIQNNLSI